MKKAFCVSCNFVFDEETEVCSHCNAKNSLVVVNENKIITEKEFKDLNFVDLVLRAKQFTDTVYTYGDMLKEIEDCRRNNENETAEMLSVNLALSSADYFIYDKYLGNKPADILSKEDIKALFLFDKTEPKEDRLLTLLHSALNMLVDKAIEDDELIVEGKLTILEELGTTNTELKYLGIDFDEI